MQSPCKQQFYSHGYSDSPLKIRIIQFSKEVDSESVKGAFDFVKEPLPRIGIVIASILGIVVLLKVIPKLRSSESDDDFDYYGEEFETSEKATPRQFMPEKTFELETQSQPEPIVVSTWEELPDGEWLDNDEEGVHWYLDNDGNHWHSTDDGYRLCDETQ